MEDSRRDPDSEMIATELCGVLFICLFCFALFIGTQ